MTRNAPYTLWLMLCGMPYSPLVSRLITQTEPETLYRMQRKELFDLLPHDAEKFQDKDLSRAHEILRQCEEKGISVTCYHDAEYPARLREIDDPPAALFHYGPLPQNDTPAIGIVGTRRCSHDAARRTAEFAVSLAMSGFWIISGMARGIDTYAHKGALYGKRSTCAVLGCGVDVLFPKCNRDLYQILKDGGTLVSEYFPQTPPLAPNFPRRNRIISGLSDGVIVMQCPEKSGAMITARYAGEQNRTLFAVPAAPEDPLGTGNNRLIKSGAVPCTEPGDVIREFQPRFGDRLTPTVFRFDTPRP